MQLWIDGGDGNGPVDYTPALVTTGPLTIRRVRGQISICSGVLDATGAGLRVPASRGCVQVLSDAGAVLFRGYLVRTPEPEVGLLPSGPENLLVRFDAAEDAWLLPHAAAAATQRAAGLQPVGAVVHAIQIEEHAVKLRAMTEAELLLTASDVTVTGGRGATTYATEMFAGDGTTSSFALMDAPFREHSTATTLLQDSFNEAQFGAQTWTLTDTGQHIGFGSGGLRVSGGNGFDGQTLLTAAVPIEMGGTVTAELDSLQLQAGSDGVLLGMYSNAVSIATCFAGFRVKGTGGAQTMVALVNGVEVGTPYTFAEGHLYTLRLRLHCAEMQRVMESFQAVVNGQTESFGGGLVNAPMRIVMEVRDLGLASNTVATVLYAGAVPSSPARCLFGLVNSVDLLCQAGGCRVMENGSAWVVSTLPDGTVVPRREGVLDDGADFALSGNKVRFWPGRVPAAGELLRVSYRRGERMFARVQDTDAIAAAQLQGVAGWPAWAGAVTQPVPRSAADCRAAAAALLAFGGDAAVGLAGSCTLVNAQQVEEVQPGDRIALPSSTPGAAALQVPVERVTITDGHAVPEVLTYAVEFAQTKANGLSFATSGTAAKDVAQPIGVSAAAVLGNLPDLQVVSASATALQMDAGVTAPNGGGFEVRRRDGGFGAVEGVATGDADLVLRSPVRSFSVPRVAFQERFYVRMYDGSAVPVYSERSSVVVTHLPLS